MYHCQARPVPGSPASADSTSPSSKYAKNKGAAIDFIKFLSSEEEQKKRVMASANPPTLESLYNDTDLVKKYPYLPTLVDSIKNANPRPKVVKYGDATLAIQDAAYKACKARPHPRTP